MKPADRKLLRDTEYAEADVVDEYGVSVDVPGMSGTRRFNPKRIVVAFGRFWWVAVIAALLGLGAGLTIARMSEETYVSRAVMWEAVKIKLPEGGLFAEDIQNFLGTQSELLKSKALHELAMDLLRIRGTNVSIPKGADGKPVPVEIQMRQAAKSAVYTITAVGPNPEYTRMFLDALMHAYTDYKRDIRKSISGDTLASISQQVQASERDLKEAQDAFSSYQRTNNLAILQQEGMVAGTYLAQLRTRLADLELEAKLLAIATAETTAGAVHASTNALSNPEHGLAPFSWTGSSGNPSLSGALPPEVQVGLRDLETLRILQARLSKHLKPKHPKMVRLTAEIERAEGLLAIYRRQNQEQLESARKSIQLRIENVQASIQQWQAKVVESNARIAEADQLRLQVNRAQAVYDRLLVLVQNVGISRNIDQDTLAILETASPAERSYSKQISAVGLATFAGLCLGLCIIVLVAFLDDGIHSQADLDDALGPQLVGQIPEIEPPSENLPLPMLAPNDKRHIYAESFRSLRSALFYLSNDLPRPAMILVTSAVPGEGKSTVSANLARSLAFGGSSVLLVDADMRRGHLHVELDAPLEPGLSDVLVHPELLEEGIHANGTGNLAFLSRGRSVDNPGDLLLEGRFGDLLSKLRQRFDYVLIDSCPVLAASDAATIGAQVDGTLFVVRRGHSKTSAVLEAMENLRQRRGKVIGVVFNRANSTLKSYQYYKYAEYYRSQDAPTRKA